MKIYSLEMDELFSIHFEFKKYFVKKNSNLVTYSYYESHLKPKV